MRSLALVCLLVGCGSVANDKKQDAAVIVPDDVTITDDTLPDMAMATCVQSPTDLRARYRAENNANDHQGNFNGATVGANFTYVPGKYGSAFSFDGDDVVTVNDSEMLWPAGLSLTLEGWMKTSTTTTSHPLVCKYACGDQCPSGQSLAYFCLFVNVDGHPVFDFRADSEQTISQVVASTVTVDDGNWHHLVAVRDTVALTATLYVDGVSVATISPGAAAFGAMTDADVNQDLVTIGASAHAGDLTYDGFFVGQIDEVAVYHRALSAAQVSAIYNAPDGKCL